MVVGVLVAILIPVLRASRERADRVSDLADLRSHAALLAAYTAEWGGEFTVFIDPRSGTGPLPGIGPGVSYFDQIQFWPLPLLSSYYDSGSLGGAFYLRSAEGDPEQASIGHNPSYIYGAAFLAAPEYWNPETRRAPPTQLRSVRADQVAFPSRKSLFDAPTRGGFLTGSPAAPDDAPLVVLAAFSDGSAGSFGADEVVAGYPSGPGYYAPWSGGPYGSTSLAYTIDGVRGLDVEAR